MVRPTVINTNPVELKCYPFMNSSDKCNGSCNIWSPKICVTRKIKDINVEVFNLITNKPEAKTMPKHISRNCKFKFNSTSFNSNQEWDNKICNCKCKSC